MSWIEIYTRQEAGYTPFLIREGWQIASLNYMPQQDIMNIDKVERHNVTDEVFILLKGSAVLIGAEEGGGGWNFDYIQMRRNVVYNIKAGEWHNIAMAKDAELIIIEKNDTHVKDCEYMSLDTAELERFRNEIMQLNSQSTQ